MKIVFNPEIQGLTHINGKYFFEGFPFDDNTVARLENLHVIVFDGDIITGRSLTDEAKTILRMWKDKGEL